MEISSVISLFAFLVTSMAFAFIVTALGLTWSFRRYNHSLEKSYRQQ